jgi:rare lipoprotein A (peptidoglycan hydrolase)
LKYKKIFIGCIAIASILFVSSTNAVAPTPIIEVSKELFKPVPTFKVSTPVPAIVDTLQPSQEHTRPRIEVPKPVAILVTPKPVVTITKTNTNVSTSGFRYDPEVSWYGPGFYGKRTACGHAYTTTIIGVAHRSLPCGTWVTFMWKGKSVAAPVIDRGPYVDGRQWDLSGALCTALNHCFTGPIYYKMGR